MNFIDRSTSYLVRFIRKNNPDAASEAVLKYSLSLLINTGLAIFISLSICTITGHFKFAVISITYLLILRYVSGGIHLSSSLSCCLLTIFMIITISHLKYTYSTIGIAFDIFSALVFLITAPNGIKGFSSIKSKYYPLLKISSLVLVASNFYLQSSVLSTANIVQAFCTTSFAYHLKDLAERRKK